MSAVLGGRPSHPLWCYQPGTGSSAEPGAPLAVSGSLAQLCSGLAPQENPDVLAASGAVTRATVGSAESAVLSLTTQSHSGPFPPYLGALGS